MNILQIKDKITEASRSGGLPALVAQSWNRAYKGLESCGENVPRTVSLKEYPLQMLCLCIAENDDFDNMTGGEKELLCEKIKSVFSAVISFLPDNEELLMPCYTEVESLMPRGGEDTCFDAQLSSDFKTLDDDEACSLALALYGIVYAFYNAFNPSCERCLEKYAAVPFGGRENVSDSQQTVSTAGTAARSTFSAPAAYAGAPAVPAAPSLPSFSRGGKIPGRWRPLKIYLIVTTLFVALVVGLVFWLMSSGVGSSGIGITDVNGTEYSVEPGMKPVELPIFGTTDYDGIISIIKNITIVFVVWRVLLITAVYIFNYKRRQKAAYHP